MFNSIWALDLLYGVKVAVYSAISSIIHSFHCLWDGTFTTLHLGLIKLSMGIDCLFMYIASFFIKLFNVMAGIHLFQDNSLYNTLAKRVYILMAVVMLFVLAYNLIYHVIDPDTKNSKFGTSGQTAKKIVVCLLGLLLAPKMFGLLANVQTSIIKYGTIGRAILSNSDEEDVDFSVGHEADAAIAQIYKAFVYPASQNESEWGGETTGESLRLFEGGMVVNFIESCGSCRADPDPDDFYHGVNANLYYASPPASACKYLSEETYKGAFENAVNQSNFLLLPDKLAPNVLINDKKNGILSQPSQANWKHSYVNNYGLTYVPGIPIIVFVYLCYTVLLFLFDLALRMFNLFLLEIMSPLAFGMYILPPPKDKIFNTWLSSYFKTYAMVFVKQAFLFLLILLMSKIVEPQKGVIAVILKSVFDDPALKQMGFFARLCVIAIIICGLFRFVNGLPKFVKDSLGIDMNAMGKSSAKAIFEDVKGGFNKTKTAVTAPYNATKKGLGHAAGAYGGARYGLRKIKDNVANAKDSKGKAKGFMSGLNALRHSTMAGMKEQNARAGVLAGQKAYEDKQQAWRNEKNEWKNMFTNVAGALEHMKISTDGFKDQIKIVLENNAANIAQVDGVVQKNMDNGQLAKLVTDNAGKKVARMDNNVADVFNKQYETADNEVADSIAQKSAAESGFVFADANAQSQFSAELNQQRNLAKQRLKKDKLSEAEEKAVADSVINKYKGNNRLVATSDKAALAAKISAYDSKISAATSARDSADKARGMIFTDNAVKTQFDQKVQAAYEKAKAADPNINEAKFKADYGSKLAQDYMNAGLMISSSTTLGARESYAQSLAYTRYEDLSAEQQALMTEEEYHAHVASAQQQAATLKSAAGEIILQYGTDHPDKLADVGLSSKDQQVLDNAVEAQMATSEIVQNLVKSGDLQEINDALQRGGVPSDMIYAYGDPKDAKDPKKDIFAGREGELVKEFATTMKTVDSYNTKMSQEEKMYQAKTGGSSGSGGSK